MLDKLFFKVYPSNTEIDDILIKCSSLNDFYSTNIFSIFPVAKHILNLNIDERLKQGDTKLVNDIANVTIANKQLCFYSFATKYCTIQCLLFMRDVKSKNYYEQMKGRGTRTISLDDFLKVSPSAKTNKDRFILFDAVGVTKSPKAEGRTLDRKPTSTEQQEIVDKIVVW